MACRRLAACLLAWILPAVSAAEPEERIAFDAALRIFDQEFYQAAEQEFAGFVELYPDSELAERAEAYRLRARAHRYALEGDHAAAAEEFLRLRLENPNSPSYLEYVVEEAWNRYHTGGRQPVLDLLDGPESPFGKAAAIRPGDPEALPFVVGGRLLLTQVLIDLELYARARRTLSQVTDWYLDTEYVWRRRLLLSRLYLAEEELALALENAESLLELAMVTENREWITESAAALAEARLASGRPEAAIAAYQMNLAPGASLERRQEAWSRLVDLHLRQRPLEAVERILEDLVAEAPQEVLTDIPLLALGRIKLQIHYSRIQEGGEEPPSQDRIVEARDLMQRLDREFPESALLAHAYFHLGWCHWELGWTERSIDAFGRAAGLFDAGEERAVSRFKVGDGLLALGRYGDALEQYRGIVLDSVPDFPGREALLSRLLYQTVRAAVKAGDGEAALEAVRELVRRFPDDLLSGKGRLIAGQYFVDVREESTARELFGQVVEEFPSFPLRPELEYVIAYSHEREGDWSGAAGLYRQWLDSHPEHGHQARILYSLARCTGLLGKEEEAYRIFGDLIEEHDGSEHADMARWWRGNHHFNRGEYDRAESSYRQILDGTGPSSPHLDCQARLMAARASFHQRDFVQAVGYLEGLPRYQTPVPDRLRAEILIHLRAEILIHLGDAFYEQGRLEEEGDRRLELFCRSQACFWEAEDLAPGTRIAALAQGRSGDLGYIMGHYPLAMKSFQRVVDSPHADIAMRSGARVSQGMIRERLLEAAAGSPGLRQDPLSDYMDVVFQKNLREEESFDHFWIQQAALKACSLLEARGGRDAAIRICEELARILPSRRPQWERMRARLELAGSEQ